MIGIARHFRPISCPAFRGTTPEMFDTWVLVGLSIPQCNYNYSFRGLPFVLQSDLFYLVWTSGLVPF